jgi:predicted helicase
MGTLDQLIATLPTDPKAKGDAFERICVWLLKNDPLYASQIDRVWLWDDWPDRWGPDTGIDLVAETHEGEFWAIQAKAYAPTTSITKADVDSFLSESNRRQFAYRLLIATTDGAGPNIRRVVKGQEKPASLVRRNDLEAKALDWSSDVDGPSPPPRAPQYPVVSDGVRSGSVAHRVRHAFTCA